MCLQRLALGSRLHSRDFGLLRHMLVPHCWTEAAAELRRLVGYRVPFLKM